MGHGIIKEEIRGRMVVLVRSNLRCATTSIYTDKNNVIDIITIITRSENDFTTMVAKIELINKKQIMVMKINIIIESIDGNNDET